MKMKNLAFCLLLVSNYLLSVSPIKVLAILATISDSSANEVFLNQSVFNYCSDETYGKVSSLLLKAASENRYAIFRMNIDGRTGDSVIETTIDYQKALFDCCLRALIKDEEESIN